MEQSDGELILPLGDALEGIQSRRKSSGQWNTID